MLWHMWHKLDLVEEALVMSLQLDDRMGAWALRSAMDSVLFTGL